MNVIPSAENKNAFARSDQTLWNHFVAHADKESLAELFYKKREILQRKVQSIVGNQSDVDETLQNSIRSIMFNVEEHRVQSVKSVQPWLIAVVRNQACMYVRRETRLRNCHLRAAVIDRAQSGPVEMSEKVEMQLLVHEIIGQLPLRNRDPVVLHYIDGLEFKLVAQQLQRKEETVKKQSQRGIVMLRNLMCQRGLDSLMLMA